MVNLDISPANLVMWSMVGGVAGWLTRLAVRGGSLGLLGNIAIGILGAFLGGLVLSRLLPGVYAITGGFSGFTLGSLIVAFVGAVILLLIVRLFTARRLHSTT